MVSDVLERPCEPFLRIDAVQLVGLYWYIGNSCYTPASGRVNKQEDETARFALPYDLGRP